jgi:hypothetical protein
MQIKWKNGQYFEGKNWIRQNISSIKFLILGDVVDGKKNGYGIFVICVADEPIKIYEYYEGNFKNDLFDGEKIWVYIFIIYLYINFLKK